jgi:hypothetical protein
MQKQTACVHLYTHPEKNECNLYVQGEQRDLLALIIAAARIDENFYNALFDAAQFIIRDEAYSEQHGKPGE